MSEHPLLRIGIVGAGKNTRDHHIPKLRAIENVEIVSVANRTLESSQQAATTLNIPTVYANWRELIEADDTDAIVIGTWPYLHRPATLAAINAGKHVMVEARMAMNATEAREMAAAAHQHPELITQIVPSPMTLHLDNTIKRLIAEGYLGDMVAVEIHTGAQFADFDSPMHWRNDMTLSGLNIMSLGIWYEAMMRWIGPAKSVMAMGKTVVKMRANADGQQTAIQIPDYLTVIGEMVCGAQLNLRLSAVTGLGQTSDSLSLFGTEGTLQIRKGQLYGGQRGDEQLTEIDVPDSESSGWRVEEEFVSAIRGLEPITHTTFTDGVAYMAFTEAVHRSIASRTMVTLPL